MQVIATAGHVDHGKSTLIRLLTGMEPDRWSEERRRGLTIDLGFAWAATPRGTTVAFVDVPGHERFVPNMLAGIGPVPAAMLVVAADEGWMPQTAEHVAALDALGVHEGLLVVTRSDLADPRPTVHQCRTHLSGTSLSAIPAVAVSGRTGQGADAVHQALDTLTGRLPRPDPDAEPRLWIDRTFTIHGSGTVVTGTLPAGTLTRGQSLVLHRSGREVGVRSLQCLGSDTDRVHGVARVAVNLRGLDRDEARRGDALVRAGQWLTTDVLDVRLRGSPAADLPRNLTLHAGSAAVPARVRPLGDDTARLSLREPLPLRVGDRALLREPGAHQVPAGVTVIDVLPPPLSRRGAARRRGAALRDVPDSPDGVSELHRRGLIRAGDLRAMGAHAPADTLSRGDWLLDPAHRDVLATRLCDLLAEHARTRPLDGGMPTEAARRALGLPDSALLEPVLAGRAAARVGERDGRLRLGDDELPAPVQDALRTVREQLTSDPFTAPTADELATLGLHAPQLAAAARAGELLKIDRGVYLLPDAPERALRRLSDLPAPFTLSRARQALGTTRRVAVPLMELLARRRRTESLPDGTHRLR